MPWLAALLALALPSLAAEHAAMAPAGGSTGPPVGEAIADAAQHYLDEGGALRRADCSGLVEAVLARAGHPATGSVRIFWREAVRRGRTHRHAVPRRGDLAFFDRTYDADGDGEVDDDLTHMAVVTSIEEDGTVVMVHHGSTSGVAELRMHLGDPAVHRDADGRVRNDVLRKAGYGGPDAARLTGQLWRGFASVGRPVAPTPRATPEVPLAPRPDLPPRELRRLARLVLRDRPLPREPASRASCMDLWYLRNLVFARHGYAFHSDFARDVFARHRWYRPDPAIHRGTVAAWLSAEDRRTVGLVLDLESERLCR